MREDLAVAIDVRAVGDPPTGVAVYTRELVRALAAAEPAWRLEIFHGSSLSVRALLGELARRPRAGLHAVPWDPSAHPAADIWEHAWLPRRLRRLRVDLFIAPAYHMPLGPLRARRLFVIYDLVPFRFPETIRRRFALYLRALIRLGARRADAVIAISATVRDELAIALGLDRGRIRVIPPGWEHLAAEPARPAGDVLARHGLTPGFVLAVGTLEPRKNLAFVVRAHARLGAGAPPLVLAGAPGPHREAVEAAARASPATVRILDYVDAADLPALYRSAGALAFPSLYEGFGIPLLEAMRCGLPAVVSAIPIFAEVAGDAALRVPVGDEAAWAAALRRALEDDALRRDLARRGALRLDRFRWARAGETLAALCRDVTAKG